MNLLITYFIIVAIGIVGAAWIGVLVDQMSSPLISLTVFFPVFFLTIWLAWRLAIWLTRPRASTS